ncbi:unnamed protein product [Euphydryas editha]|uniref:Uncharacterized protein n=1 Tax=Euphydryas editha TaxID=104508 RepID=A0AAU9UXL7_EUPED|nr:unnamed protein product [Euphydryas editha]
MLILFVTLIIIQNACSLTCKDILDMPKNSKIKLYELETLQPKEIVDCISHLGRIKLNISEAEFIWNSIIKFYNEIPLIPDEILSCLHWVTIAIKPEEYQNLTLSNIDIITNFGLDYDLSNDQLVAIADRVREDFGAKQPEDYTVYDLTALRQILCAFQGSEIKRIHPKSYKEAALLVRKLKNCSDDVMEGFASLATHKDAFGPPENWKRETICILGGVVQYLSENVMSKLKKNLGNDILEEIDKDRTLEEECN